MFRITFISCSLSLLLTTAFHIQIANAEEIRIPIGEQAKTQPAIDMPSKGMSKERVKSLFGEPLEEVPAKGQPPISRWKYQEFTVYFDSNTVIHCVRNFHPKVQSAEPQPAETQSTEAPAVENSSENPAQ